MGADSIGRYPNIAWPPPVVQEERRSLMVSSARMYLGFGCVLVDSCCGSNQQLTGVVGGASGL